MSSVVETSWFCHSERGWDIFILSCRSKSKHLDFVILSEVEMSLFYHVDKSRDILILSFWAKRRICKWCYNGSVLSALSFFHVVTGPFCAIFWPDTTRKYTYWMMSCSDRAFFDSFSTGHDTPKNCVWRSFTSFRMTEWGSGGQMGGSGWQQDGSGWLRNGTGWLRA